MKNLLSCFILPVFLFCNFQGMKDLNRNNIDKAETKNQSSNKIGYLFFKVEKDASGVEKITLQEKKITEGKLKSNSIFDEKSTRTGDFIISLTDTNGKEIIKQKVEDPLNPSMETYEDGISRTKVSLQNAEFSVRYSHSENISAVKIEKVTSKGSQLIFTQKL
ncbi:hypothetical protein SAMN05421664_2872 [Chryseobacterium soldanellicola]|uniref:Uncharacterized protein n=1 Tax=Chryseobacterium soldanellicola TaxID=311333 RepID=A0A1H1ECT5_9FLAO|nr:hypothetical protein [Chryseobacterium soldanellicola]SDQ85976.1 hypothetical protein SAMN05421664_2872 [Chryseobacterium soldanellicola]